MIILIPKRMTSAYPPPAGGVSAIKFTNSPSRLQIYELASYYRFNPNAASLVYYARTQFPQNLLGTLWLTDGVNALQQYQAKRWTGPATMSNCSNT